MVIAILGISLGVVMFALERRTEDRPFAVEAAHLKSIMSLASEEAVFRGREYGLVIIKQEEVFSYHVVSLNVSKNKIWEVVDSPAFRKHELPDFIRLEVKMDDQQVALPTLNDALNQPTILFLSSGEVTPFEMQLFNQISSNLEYRLTSDGVNEIMLEKVAE